jgi:hypothetical protein
VWAIKVDNPYSLLSVLGHVYLSGVWAGVASRTNTKKTCLREIGLCAQNTIRILVSIVNITGGT